MVYGVKGTEELHRSWSQVMVVKMNRSEEIQALFWRRRGLLMKRMWGNNRNKGSRNTPQVLASTNVLAGKEADG